MSDHCDDYDYDYDYYEESDWEEEYEESDYDDEYEDCDDYEYA